MAKMTKSDPARTTAMGLFTDADQTFLAAKVLMASDDRKVRRKVRRPIYYLLGHAIELALKSYLLANGETLDFVRKEIGHDLEKAASLVWWKDTGEVSVLLDSYKPDIKQLNKIYQAKHLEYRVTGSKRYPKASDLCDFLERMLPLIERIAGASLPEPPVA